MASGQWPAASGGQCWRLVANGCQWRPPVVPHMCISGGILATKHYDARFVYLFSHNYEHCHWQVANVANINNVAIVAKVASVAIVPIANAYKCQCHRHHHHDEYE